MIRHSTFVPISAFLALVFLNNGAYGGMLKQGVAIKGKLLCGLTPVGLNTTKVRIVDIDFGPDPDDTLDEKIVGSNGEFALSGFTHELTPIDPVLYIWTDCNDNATPCHRKIKFILPKEYIIKEQAKPTEWLDFGVINLHSVFKKETRECAF